MGFFQESLFYRLWDRKGRTNKPQQPAGRRDPQPAEPGGEPADQAGRTDPAPADTGQQRSDWPGNNYKTDYKYSGNFTGMVTKWLDMKNFKSSRSINILNI